MWSAGNVTVDVIREVEIEDLLGRESVAPDDTLLGRCIMGKTVLVSGAGGSIGSELCRQIVRLQPSRLVLLERSEFALYSIEQELASLCARRDLSCRTHARAGVGYPPAPQ
jgi:FlaA1/EpsC-like NDP-sugar epimerase